MQLERRGRPRPGAEPQEAEASSRGGRAGPAVRQACAPWGCLAVLLGFILDFQAFCRRAHVTCPRPLRKGLKKQDSNPVPPTQGQAGPAHPGGSRGASRPSQTNLNARAR